MEEPDAVTRDISDAEFERTFTTQTTYSDAFVVAPTVGGVRISFGHRSKGNVNYFHTSILMPSFEAFELRNVLTHLLKDQEAELQERLDGLVAAAAEAKNADDKT